jgi:hypothetical protein
MAAFGVGGIIRVEGFVDHVKEDAPNAIGGMGRATLGERASAMKSSSST